MLRNRGIRIGAWGLAALVAAALGPAAAGAQDYGSQQQSMHSYSANCGHLGSSCDAPAAPKQSACGHSSRKKSHARKTGMVQIRAYAAPRALRGDAASSSAKPHRKNKRSHKASCARNR